MEHNKPIISFAAIGDVQYADRDPYIGRDYRGSLDMLRRTIERINEYDLDFTVMMGDLGDGISRDEFPKIFEVLKNVTSPVRYVAGNHDFVLHTPEELCSYFNVDDLFYDFEISGVVFIVINSLEESRFSQAGSQQAVNSAEYKKKYHYRILREWEGKLSQDSFDALENKIASACQSNKKVVIFSHVPICPESSDEHAWMYDADELLGMFDKYDDTVIAVIAGHHHAGGCAIRKNVLHRTLKAICNVRVPSAVICRIFSDGIEVEGIGAESGCRTYFEYTPAKVCGRYLPGAYIIADTGEFCKADEEGNFSLVVEQPGEHSFKAVADGYADSFVARLQLAPNEEREITFTLVPDPGRKVYTGETCGFDLLHITDDGEPVYWFDLDGKAFGADEYPGKWHEHNNSFYSRGKYAFSAKGKVELRRTNHPDLKKYNWYKGDFHAHLEHGEKFYSGNVNLSAFIARCEHYDWLYLSGPHGDPEGDPAGQARANSDNGFLLRLNDEFPKNRNGHVGNCGIGPVGWGVDDEKVSNLTLVKEYIAPRGGVAIPVHPLYGNDWMRNSEVALWLWCAPEECPCLDIFYNRNTPGALEYYLMLLNKGWRIGVTSTSDAAFDVGRTPGDRGCTYIFADELSEKKIVQAMRRRNTAVGFDGCAVITECSGKVAGDILAPGEHTVKMKVFPVAEETLELSLFTRSGLQMQKVIRQNEVADIEYTGNFSDGDYCFVQLNKPGDIHYLYAAVSPLFFRSENFKAPEVLSAPQVCSPKLKEYLHSPADIQMSEVFFDRVRDLLLEE